MIRAYLPPTSVGAQASIAHATPGRYLYTPATERLYAERVPSPEGHTAGEPGVLFVLSTIVLSPAATLIITVTVYRSLDWLRR